MKLPQRFTEMYGYDRTNIFKYTLKGSSSTEFLDKKLLY